MSVMTNFYYSEKLIEYGIKKTCSDSSDIGMQYCIDSGFLDQRGQPTEAGKNFMQFMDKTLLVPTKVAAHS